MFFAFTRPRYQVSLYRTIGPLVIVIIHVSHKTSDIYSKLIIFV